MGGIGVVRPRRTVPRAPAGELTLEPPPEPEKIVPAGVLQRLLPLVMLLASVGFIAVLGVRNPTSWLFGGMFMISTLGMVLAGGGGRGGGNRAATVDEDRRDYLRYLAQLRRRVRAIAGEQRAVLEAVHPEVGAWPAVLAAGRMWERRPGDPDFGQLRVGQGPQRLATRLVAPQTGPVEGIEPITALALRRFLTGHAVVSELPVALSLRSSTTVWLEPAAGSADLGPARALARSMVAQYALWHSPSDALLAVVAPPVLAASWEWAKWLPHAAHPRRRDEIGPLRMLTTDADEVRRWWVSELAGRPTGPGPGEPHLLVVVDEVAEGPGPWAAVAGVTVLRVGPPPGRRPAPSVVRLLVDPDGVQRTGGEERGDGEGRAEGDGTVMRPIGRPDGLTVAEARALARRLARYRTDGPDPASGSPRTGLGLPALLGLAPGRAGIAALRARWAGNETDRLRVPLGLDETGGAVTLDLKESAQGGSGPHGLCVGATGSGKSELLRTLVLGLAATHSSEDLNLVLVDFKGGATFLGMSRLPHVAAVITNLADELTLVDRMADALAGEITRRQERLRAAGNLTGVAEYAAARRGGADLPPLPALFVVVDEFSELLTQRPELLELMVTIGRLGRSLGMHLLLASQRLEEGRLRGLESHLSYRIALRTFSASESRAVLGVPDAHQLPATPGVAFLSTGTEELVRFRAAYVSGPAAAEPVRRAPAVERRAHVFGVAPIRVAPPPEVDEPPEEVDDATVLETVLAALDGQGPPAHRVWLPPLGDPPPLDELVGAPRPQPGRGLAASGGRGGALRVPVAWIDRPYQQRRDPLLLDVSGAAGHLAVAGGPRSGKSTALATAVVGLALTHTPVELGIHVLDFGGGTLTPLAGLPHVGTVADRLQPDLVRRTVAEVSALLTRRERLFRDSGITSIETFRARRRTGEFSGEPATDLLLVVDGYMSLRNEFEDLETRLLSIAAQGLSFGVHLAVTAGRWSDLRPAFKDLFGSRWELRLGDASDSEIDRRRAAAVPPKAGHGLAPDGAAMVLAAPRLSAAATDLPTLVTDVAAAWPGAAFDPVRLLPERLDHDRLPAPEPGAAGIPIGVDEERLALVQLDVAAEPHLLCFADAESGKTSLLRLLVHGVVERFRPDEARIVVVDYRRGLLGAVPGSHLIGYASTPDAAADAAREVAGSMRRRLPGPDVTPRALRERSWWTGPEVYVLIDDYDLVAPTGGHGTNPVLPLLEFLPQAKDVGLHLVVARRCGGAGRALFDPLLGRLRELAAPGLVMNGSPDEGVLVGSVKPGPAPPGRGTLVDRRRGARRVQLAWLPPDDADP